MVFDKQHLSLFVALAFFMVYANAGPTALSNEPNVERLRGDLHQFIEMIINCLTNSKTSHSKIDPAQLRQFKKITNSLQVDVGLGGEEAVPENSAENGGENEGENVGENAGENVAERKFIGDAKLPEDEKPSTEEVAEPAAETSEENAERKSNGGEGKPNEGADENNTNEAEGNVDFNPETNSQPESRSFGKNENKLIPFDRKQKPLAGMNQDDNIEYIPESSKPVSMEDKPESRSMSKKKDSKDTIEYIPESSKSESMEDKPESRSFSKKKDSKDSIEYIPESSKPESTEDKPESRSFSKKKDSKDSIEYIPESTKPVSLEENGESMDENPESRSFDKKKDEDELETETEIIGQISAEIEEKNNRREFDLAEGDSHNFTPRPTTLDINSGMTQNHRDHAMHEDDDEGSSVAERKNIGSEDTTNTGSVEGAVSDEGEELKSQLGKIKQTLGSSQYKHKGKSGGRKNNGDDSDESAKASSESNTEEIEVRNLIKDNNSYASDSSVEPYEALHIYGIQANGPINRIVFEGGEHHPPRPLTVKESNHLKEFIKMVLNTNKMHNPLVTFPNPNPDGIAPRSGGFSDREGKGSPWAEKPVPVELV